MFIQCLFHISPFLFLTHLISRVLNHLGKEIAPIFSFRNSIAGPLSQNVFWGLLRTSGNEELEMKALQKGVTSKIAHSDILDCVVQGPFLAITYVIYFLKRLGTKRGLVLTLCVNLFDEEVQKQLKNFISKLGCNFKTT